MSETFVVGGILSIVSILLLRHIWQCMKKTSHMSARNGSGMSQHTNCTKNNIAEKTEKRRRNTNVRFVRDDFGRKAISTNT